MSSNIHFQRTHRVFVSQLIRYSEVNMNTADFLNITKRLTHKLIRQGFYAKFLRKKFSYFFDKYYHMVKKYNLSKKKCMIKIFEM